MWGWLQIKGQHSRNSSLLRASSPSPPPLRFREEMVSPAPEDLQTSWAGPPSLSDLQHPDLCHQRTVHAQQRSVTIGCMHVSAGAFGLCYVWALARDWVSTCFSLDSRASVPSVLCGYACVCLQMYASYLQYVFDVLRIITDYTTSHTCFLSLCMPVKYEATASRWLVSIKYGDRRNH